MNYQLLCLVFSLCVQNIYMEIIFEDDIIEGYYWREYHGGAVPKDALPGGKNENNGTTYIGQILHMSLLIPAKIDPQANKVTYEWGYKEYVTNINIKILCTMQPEGFEWLHTGNGLIQNIDPKLLVVGGFEPGAKIYIGRKQLEKELALGKIISGSNQSTLNTSKDGVGTQHAEFDILSFNPKRLPNNSSIIDIRVQDTKIPNKTCAKHTTVISYYN